MQSRYVILATLSVLAILTLYWYQTITTGLQQLAYLGPLTLTLAAMLQVLLAPIPPGGISILAGNLYGTLPGLLYVGIGILTGSIIVFTLAKRYGYKYINTYLDDKQLQRYMTHIQEHGAEYLFISFFLPFFPDDLLCIVAGLTDVPTWEFILVLFIGRIPLFTLYTFTGANLHAYNNPWFISFILIILATGTILLWKRDQLRSWIHNNLS